MTNRELSKEIRTWKQNSSQKAVSAQKCFSENSTNTNFAQPEGHMNNEDMLRLLGDTYLSRFSQ